MRHTAFVIAACLIWASAAVSAAAAPRYEAVVIPGTPKANAGFLRIEIATGKVWQSWGAGTQFVAVTDSAALPAGEYHLYPSSTANIDGSITWTLNRMDVATGRSWVATGGGNAPLVWNEIVNPK